MSRFPMRLGVAVCVVTLLAAVAAGIALRTSLPDLAELDPAGADAYRAAVGEATVMSPIRLGDFDVYRSAKGIAWVKKACANADLERSTELTIYPMGTAAGYGRDVAGIRLGEACLWQARLRGAAIAQVNFRGIGRINSDAYMTELRHRYVLAATEPAARSTFDVYWEEPGAAAGAGSDGGRRTLTYVKKHCRESDTAAPFFLHVKPVSADSLPPERRRHGFASLDFQWQAALVASVDSHCVASLALPGYAIATIATGQYMPGGTMLWRISIAPPDAGDDGT